MNGIGHAFPRAMAYLETPELLARGPLGSEGGHRVRCSVAGQEAVAALEEGLSEPEGWWATGKVTE